MTLKHFSQRALKLLYQGVLQQERLLEAYCFIKSYEAGDITYKAVQDLLDDYDPNLESTFPFNNNKPPF